jgi:hypothetical protein
VEGEDFSHGSYGDYAGVAFYGPPTEGFWFDRLAVSERYIDPLFSAIADRSGADAGEGRTPRVVRDWQALEGWAGTDGITELPGQEAEQLLGALALVTVADVAPYCAGASAEECLRCAALIRRFLGERLARGVSLFIEND